MKAALVKINYSCNNECIFCHENKKDSSLDSASLKRILDFLKKNDLKKVFLSGGEPSINKNFLGILRKFKEEGIKCGIVTNGILFYNKDFLEKASSYIDEFHITLLSSDKDVHNWLTGNSNSFDKTVHGIKNIKEKGSILINHIVNSKNQDRLEEFVKFCQGLGIENIKISLLLKKGRAVDNWNILKPDIARLLSTIKGLCNKKGVVFENFPLCAICYDKEKSIAVIDIVDFVFDCDGKAMPQSGSGHNEKFKPISCKHFCESYRLCEGYLKEYNKEFKEFIKTRKSLPS